MNELMDLICLNHLAGNDKANKPLVDMVCIDYLTRQNKNSFSMNDIFGMNDIENLCMGRPIK
jgi:hypothetical protein